MALQWWQYPITQGYGPTNEPLDSGYAGYAHFNKGLDYGTPANTPITALVGGRVIAAGPGSDGWGTRVWIQDANGYIHNYGHLNAANVQVGDTIQPGQVIGVSGSTGNSTGPHLSYDVWKPTASGPEYINPQQFVSGGGAQPAAASAAAVGPDGRTFDQITGTEYKSDAERQWYWEQKGKSPPSLITPPVAGGAGLLPAQTPGEQPMAPEDDFDKFLAGRNKPQGGLTEQELIDAGAVKKAPGLYEVNGVQYRIQDDKTYSVASVAGPSSSDPNVYTYTDGGSLVAVNRLTGEEMWRRPLSAESTKAQGAVTTQQLQQAGASMSVPGVATVGGQRYVQNSDGTWSPSGTPSASSGTVRSGSGLLNLVGNKQPGAVGSLAQPKNGLQTAVQIAQQNKNKPLSGGRFLTEDEISRATATEGLQEGDLLGGAYKYMTGLSANLPITYGGIPEGGGLQADKNNVDRYGLPIQYSGQVPEGYFGENSPSMSIGVGAGGLSGAMEMLRAAGIPQSVYSKLDPTKLADVAQNLMATKQLALDKGLVFPDLAAMQSRMTQAGGTSKQEYQNALNNLWTQISGQPLSALDLYWISQMEQQAAGQQPDPATGARLYDYQGNPIQGYANGGNMVLNRPAVLKDLATDKPLALMGEAGEQEMVSNIRPLGVPQRPGLNNIILGREQGGVHTMPYPNPNAQLPMMSMWQRLMMPNFGLPQRGLRGFATGGNIYSGFNSGFTEQYPAPEESPLKSDTFAIRNPGPGGTGGLYSTTDVRSAPIVTAPTQFDNGMYGMDYGSMSPEDRAKFSGGVPGTAQQTFNQRQMQDVGPVQPTGSYMYDPSGRAVPVYESANQGAMAQAYAQQQQFGGGPVQEVLTPTTIGGQTVYIKTYTMAPPHPTEHQRQGQADALTFWLMNSPLGGLFGNLFGWGDLQGGQHIDPLAQAQDQRRYDMMTQRRAAAGLAPAPILDLRETDDEGRPYYRNYSGTLPNGVVMPFGYDPARAGNYSNGRQWDWMNFQQAGGSRGLLGSALQTG